jgi:hypothetical protein
MMFSYLIDENTYFLLGHVIQDGTFLEFSYRQVDVYPQSTPTPTPSSVPEPSPFWLFGVGMCVFRDSGTTEEYIAIHVYDATFCCRVLERWPQPPL